MQAFVKKFKDNVKARAGDGKAITDFKVYRSAVLLQKSADTQFSFTPDTSQFTGKIQFGNTPKQLTSTKKVLLIEETQLVKTRDYPSSVQPLNSPSLNMSVTEVPTSTFAVPRLSETAISDNSNGRWKDMAFVVARDKARIALNNQFSEPLGSTQRAVYQHAQSMRDFGEQAVFISRQFFPNVTDNNSLELEIADHVKFLKQERIRMSHPRWGMINVAVDGELIIDNLLNAGCAFIIFNLKEVTSDITEEVPALTKEQEDLNTLEKIAKAYSTARNYAFASVSEFTATVNQLDRVSNAFTRVASDLDGLKSNIVNSLNAFNRLANSIGVFKNSSRNFLNTPAELGDKIKEIFQNFDNVINGFEQPTPNSTASYQKNITIASAAYKLISNEELALDNSILLSSTDPETKASYETMTMTKHVQAATLAVFLIDEANFHSVDDIDLAFTKFKNIANSIMNYKLYFGQDIYKNNITHQVQYQTIEMQEMIDAFAVIYNRLMLKLFNQKIELLYANTTNIQKMPVLQLLHCLYQGQYDLSDAEREHVFYERLCRMNPNIYQTNPYVDGLVKY